MLAKILEDMWVEPAVLEALSEEQKRVLFLKMREEQVRRWKVRQEAEDKENREHNDKRGKKAYHKQVSWLLGRDGDVCVSVIGEMDEFRSSKLLHSLRNNHRERSDNLNGTGRDARQEDVQLSLKDVTMEPACQVEPASEEDRSLDWTPVYRPHLNLHGSPPPALQQHTDITDSYEEKRPGGRVARLRQTLADNPQGNTTSHSKPPLPVKPAHLLNRATPLVH